MRLSAEIALTHQQLAELERICRLDEISEKTPTGPARDRVKDLILKIKSHVLHIERRLTNELLDKACLYRNLPATQRDLLDQYILPKKQEILRAYSLLHPDLADLDEFFDRIGMPAGAGGRVLFTFEEAIERMWYLIDDAPHLEHEFSIKKAERVLESELVRFRPDEWLDRAGELRPIIAGGANFGLPLHIHLRLREIYRSYIFGNFISVISLARAALEYCLLDNLNKFGISATYYIDMPRRETRKKSLRHLIDDVVEFIPTIKEDMHAVRDCGNDYIHPKKTDASKQQLLQAQRDARRSLVKLVRATTRIYAASRKD